MTLKIVLFVSWNCHVFQRILSKQEFKRMSQIPPIFSIVVELSLINRRFSGYLFNELSRNSRKDFQTPKTFNNSLDSKI